MSAVVLPAAIDALVPGASPTAAAADQRADFSELLSSVGAVPGGSDKGRSPDADTAAASILDALQVAKEPEQLILAQAPLPVVRESLERPEDADAKVSRQQTQEPVEPTAILMAILQSLVQAGGPPAKPGEAATVNSARPDEEDDERAGSKSLRHDHALESAGWTMQQALAAVAAIAAPAAAARASGDPAPAANLALKEAPAELVPSPKAGQSAQAAKTVAEALSPSGGTPIVATGISKLAATASKSSLESQTGDLGPKTSATATPELAIPLDPQLLTTAIGHARLSAMAPNIISSPGAPQHQDLDLQQLDALVRDIAAVSGTSARAEFRLTASQLGPLDVRLHTSDAGVAVTIRTHDDQSHTTVAQAQQQLSDDMRANGLKVAATNVMLGGDTDRQRHDRPNGPALPIEVAAPEADQPQPSSNEQRPEGRYA